MSAPTLAAHLACPRCEQSLRQYPDRSWGCGACGLGFPSLLDVPCLFAEPAATLTEWRGRLQFSLEKLAHEAAQLQTELQNPRLRPLTRDRLTLLNRATLDQLKRLRELLSPLAIHQAQAALATHLALQTRLPGDQGLTTYDQNIHRDWGWGDEENEATLRLVGGALPGREAVDSLLVLGSGAGRLAYDLHQEYAIGLTLALDFNPLLTLVARRAVAGEITELWEFPLAPRTLAENAVLRELVAPELVREGFHLLLGDALRPPLAAGSFDVIVTPWFVDILPEDILNPADLEVGFTGSVLDLLMRRGSPQLAHSLTDIQAVAAVSEVARALEIQRGDVLLFFEARLFDIAGKVVDLSESYFLPGYFHFHVVRSIG